ncbi:hypothetical protein BH09ACT4_BH09ACT4_03020 [soil metagenome]
MTGSEIERLRFTSRDLETWARLDPRHTNWPVVYVLDGPGKAYVGETRNTLGRMRQHLANPEKAALTAMRVVIDETFNKSACLDLESHLIRWLAGDGQHQVLNQNHGITDADYFDRDRYREAFADIFGRLKAQGVFTHTIPQIESGDLFKLSPFKALNSDQEIAIDAIVEGLAEDLTRGGVSTITVLGEPGTGKTVVGIFLLKLLVDIGATQATDEAELDSDSLFSEFFLEGTREVFTGLRLGMVIPQQSLRKSVKKVFKSTPGLDPTMVLSPFEVGKGEPFDLLIVDETHRLSQRANQPAAALNIQFGVINEKLFGADSTSYTQFDWIKARSTHQIFLLDAAQTVKPADLPSHVVRDLISTTASAHRSYRLTNQMRVAAGSDYVGFIRRLLDPGRAESHEPLMAPDFGEYDLRFFDDFAVMRAAIRDRDREHGLARLVAGFAWPWTSRGIPDATDIEIDGVRMPWNRTQVDWIASPGSLDQMGSIHTVQGYDLNYAGVVIGPDVRFEPVSHRVVVDRASYFDAFGKQNNRQLGIVYSDADLLSYIVNIYAVLLTRGIRGTYIYVCDPGLREYLRTAVTG